jgi:hypothetical protein
MVRMKVDSVKIHYKEMCSEGREDFMCAIVAVIFGVCKTVIITCSFVL